MSDRISYNNKDILFKVLSQYYQNKSLEVYGLNIPRIKQLLPSNFPAVTATEIHAENAFLLVDDSLFILEYESSATLMNFIKYNKYAINAYERLHNEGYNIKRVIIAVIYTGDIKSSRAELDLDALRIQVQQVFLSNFDTKLLYNGIKSKIDACEPLNDNDVMKFIILPLTQPNETQKQKLIEDTIDLAKQVQDEKQQLFIIAGVLTATDKFIDQKYSNSIKEWIKMTKVARLFEEEKIEAVNSAVNEAIKNKSRQIAKSMLADGEDIIKIMKHTGLSRAEIDKLNDELLALKGA